VERGPDKRRPRFRHELASALGLLELLRRATPSHDAVIWPDDELRAAFAIAEQECEAPSLPADAAPLVTELRGLNSGEFDLLLYLVAAHHGKVRMSLRGTPDERGEQRQARGVRDNDELPPVVLPGLDAGTTVAAPRVSLHLDPMELGLGFRYGRSWRERTQSLLETHGPFRLGWYEALLRVADARASRRAEAE
jgi:CRISPR-associated endonuclease/helicase Cas3